MISELFGAVAGTYDSGRRRLVPCFDAFYGTAVELATRRLPAAPRVLDLGAGTGLLTALLAAQLPDATFVLVDGSAEMLAVAERNLGRRAAVHVRDLRDPLPAGPFDAVVSALAIHHLTDPEKKDLYARVPGVLAPGGVFVNAEQVAGPTSELDALYHQVWLDQTRQRGADAAELAAAAERMAFDRPAPVADQVAWLGEAGLRDADCFFKQYRFAVFAGWTPSPVRRRHLRQGFVG